MKKFFGVILAILALTLICSSVINIVRMSQAVTASAESELPQETYTYYLDFDSPTYTLVSPYSYSDFFSTCPNFALVCYGDNSYSLNTIYSDTVIENSVSQVVSFNLSSYISTFVDIVGFSDDYEVEAGTAEISSSFTQYDSGLGECVLFRAKEDTLLIVINNDANNRKYTITIDCDNILFFTIKDQAFYSEFVYYFQPIDPLFENGYREGYDEGYVIGNENGYREGYDEGYANGVETGFDGDLFGSSLVPSINSLLRIEIFPNVPIYTLLNISFGVVLLGLCIKIFLGG